MNDYRNFQVDDFIEDPLFLDWILEDDKIAAHFWKEWLLLNPDKRVIIYQAYELLLKGNSSKRPIKQPDRTLFQDVNNNFTTSTNTSHYQQIQQANRSIRKRLFAIASICVIASGIGLFFIDRHAIYVAQDFATSFSILPPRFVSIINTKTTNLTIPLADGSTVEVGPGSELNYPMAFTKRDREVYLNGTAYFKIVRQEDNRLFRINTSMMSAETESAHFNIDAARDEKLTAVKVDSGNVYISSYRNFVIDRLLNFFSDDPPFEASVSSNQSAIVNTLGEVLINLPR